MSGNLTEKRTVERAARPLERAEHTRGRNGATGEKRGDNGARQKASVFFDFRLRAE